MKNGLPENAGSTPVDAEAAPDMWFVEYLTPHDAYHHGVRKLLHASQSEFQSITIADTGAYGRALFLDGKIQTTERDEPYYHEPLLHVPCLLHGCPKRVLVLGGADGGTAREALRWRGVEEVLVVDIDEAVVSACRLLLPDIARGAWVDDRCRLVVQDALDFVEEGDDVYDVIVCDLTDPIEEGPSLALFTTEFFGKLKRKLAKKGALSIQVGPSSLVEGGRLMPRICATLREMFYCVAPYQVFVPTYGSPLGMAVASDGTDKLPNAEKIDVMFKELVEGDNVVLDGRMVHGLFALPRILRIAVDEERDVYTDRDTATAFGKGSVSIQQ